jgi:hypothetical protein
MKKFDKPDYIGLRRKSNLFLIVLDKEEPQGDKIRLEGWMKDNLGIAGFTGFRSKSEMENSEIEFVGVYTSLDVSNQFSYNGVYSRGAYRGMCDIRKGSKTSPQEFVLERYHGSSDISIYGDTKIAEQFLQREITRLQKTSYPKSKKA